MQLSDVPLNPDDVARWLAITRRHFDSAIDAQNEPNPGQRSGTRPDSNTLLLRETERAEC